MRYIPLLFLLAAGCASNDPDDPHRSAGSKLGETVVDAAVSPLKLKKIPPSEREDEGGREPAAREPRKAKTVTFGTLVVDTPVPEMPVFVDGQGVGKSRDAGNGRGTLRVRVTTGLHVLLCNGVERNVVVRAGEDTKPVTIAPYDEAAVEETK